MGLFDRIGRVLRANINDLVNKAEDPEKILEQSIIDMQEDLIQLRQAVASAIASQKKSQQQYNTARCCHLLASFWAVLYCCWLYRRATKI